MRGNDEKQARKGERHACGDPPRGAQPEHRDFDGDEPDTGEEDQQESDFRKGDARLMCESKHQPMTLLTVCVRRRNVFKDTGDREAGVLKTPLGDRPCEGTTYAVHSAGGASEWRQGDPKI